MGRRCFLLFLAGCITLSGCHTRSHDADNGIGGGIKEGMLAPLEDLNIRREKIPDILAELDVYQKPVPQKCAGLAIEIQDLEAFVGADLDVTDEEERTSLRTRFSEIADDQAYSLVADVTTDFIPFRGVVRRATGATAHERAIREAYRNGRLRRSYLKGVGFAMGCAGPAAPLLPTTLASKDEIQVDADAATFHVLEVPPAW